MSKDMKLILENWRKFHLQETEDRWFQSKDVDHVSRKNPYFFVFSANDLDKPYPEIGENNHGLTSHFIKHANEFDNLKNWHHDLITTINDRLKNDEEVYLRSPAGSIKLTLDLLNRLKVRDKDAERQFTAAGFNSDKFKFVLKNPLNAAKATMDFYLDLGDMDLVNSLIGDKIAQYHKDALSDLEECPTGQGYSAPSPVKDYIKQYCVNNDVLTIGGISAGVQSLNTRFTPRPREIKKMIDKDKYLKKYVSSLSDEERGKFISWYERIT